jgi:hypothetical protein
LQESEALDGNASQNNNHTKATDKASVSASGDPSSSAEASYEKDDEHQVAGSKRVASRDKLAASMKRPDDTVVTHMRQKNGSDVSKILG